MKNKFKWHLLQLFAEGGEGSASGSECAAVADNTGVSDAAAGHQRLRELGVPDNKIRKNRSYTLPKPAKTTVEAEPVAKQVEAVEQDDAAEKPTEDVKRMTWEEIKADPEYGEQLNKMMRARAEKSKEAEEALQKLTPSLQALAKLYGMDHEKIDHQALNSKIMEDDRLYEDKALEHGHSPEVERKLDQFDLMKEREDQRAEEQMMQRHYTSLVSQGEALKAKYPGFDLQAELKNPTFARMTAPGVNVPVETAYYAIHRQEIEQAALEAASEQVKKNVANAVRSGTMRPQENGSSAAAPSVSTFDYRKASPEQRAALKARIRQAGARGEKVYPGQ